MGAAVIAEYPEWGRTNQYFRWILGCSSPAITRLVLGSRLLANNRSITGIAFSRYSICKDYRAAKGSPRTAVSTESKTLCPWIFATPPTVIGSPRY
jgi:hypothetical protein